MEIFYHEIVPRNNFYLVEQLLSLPAMVVSIGTKSGRNTFWSASVYFISTFGVFPFRPNDIQSIRQRYTGFARQVGRCFDLQLFFHVVFHNPQIIILLFVFLLYN
jgi:hypothetical protein